MASLYTLQSKNVHKTWLLILVFLVVVIAVGYVFAAAYNSPAILYVAIIFALGMNFVSYWWSDSIVLKLAGARPALREQYFDLYTVVENLAITAGLPKPKVYVIDDPVPNAFATGRDKEHAVVAATTGLLAVMERSELEGVIGHELSHIGNRDILLSTVVVVLVGFLSIMSHWFLRAQMFSSRSERDSSSGVFMLIGLVLAVLSPIVATFMQLAISRQRELLADASGALLTRYPEGLARALEKIAAHEGTMIHANNASAHLYISNPFGAQASRGVAKLFMTHPPIEERIKLLRGMSL